MKSDPTLKKWYRIINKKFFDGQLPNNVLVRWANKIEENDKRWEEKYFAGTNHGTGIHSYEIILSRKKNVASSSKLSTLAHEMCHVATKLKDDHGPAFDYWHKYIFDRGIFKKSALRKGLTIF